MLAIKEKIYGPEHLEVAASANDLALLYNCEEKYTEAEPLYVKALQIREKNLGPQHPDVIRTREIYAAMLRQEGRKAEAQKIEMQVEKSQMTTFQNATL